MDKLTDEQVIKKYNELMDKYYDEDEGGYYEFEPKDKKLWVALIQEMQVRDLDEYIR